MEDLECRFCNLVFRDPVLLDTFNYYNSCRSCAIGNVVGKGKVKLPDSDLVVEIDDASRLRPNVTLSFLLEELQRESEVREKVLSLLDSLSLFSVVGYDPVPYQVETENTVDLVVQAPERFSTFVDLVAVVDFSASMKGPKSELLKETLKYFIENLDENDRFGVVAFASGVHRVFEIEAATAENKARWIRKLTAASPKNKSNLCGGLLEGLDMLGNLKGRRSNASMVVFTDGMATKGEVEEESILKATKEALQQYNMRVTIHTFGYRKHQVTLMKGLTELYTGQYFYIQSPHQIPESLAISFTDIRRSHFHDIKLAVEIIDTGSVKQIGTKLPVGPLPGTTSMKKGCIVKVNQLSERRQKNILFRVLNPKLASPDAQYKFMRATLTYLDTSLSLRRRQQIVVHIARDGSANAPLKEKQEVTTQWNRILTGTTLEQAAKLGRDKATHDQGIELLVKAMEATRMTDEGDPLDTDSASVFYHTLKKGKKLLEKQATLDDSNFGKLIDMANAFLHEQSSVFIDAYNTDAVDLAIEEIRESTQAIETEEEGDTFEEEYIDANGIKLPPPIKKKHPSTRLNDDGKFKIVKGRKMGGEDDELEIPKFRLNSFKKFQPQKEKEVSELYTKLTKGNLSLQEIEARLARNKKQKQSEPMSELDMILKARRKKTQEPQMAYKTLKGRSPKTLAVENDSDDHIAAAPTEVEFTHQALHDFRPRTAQEIELRQGDPVVLIKRQGDFAEVENCRSRRTGLVPFNYLAIILIGENDTSFPTHVALYNFTPRTEQEIELEKDDQIMVTKERNDGYYEGLNTRTENFGLFPATHVAPRITHEAVRDFFSGLSTEVEMKKGDGVIVTKIRDDGWLQGQNVRTGKFGLIPSSFVRKAESQA